MGCGISKEVAADVSDVLVEDNRTETSTTSETNLIWADPDNEEQGLEDDGEPGCTIGSRCKSFEAGKRNVVVLFGGVGTHKGDLTDMMGSEYAFHLICMEELVSIVNYGPLPSLHTRPDSALAIAPSRMRIFGLFRVRD